MSRARRIIDEARRMSMAGHIWKAELDRPLRQRLVDADKREGSRPPHFKGTDKDWESLPVRMKRAIKQEPGSTFSSRGVRQG